MWQKIKNIYHLLQAAVSTIYFNFPSKKLKVVGVTGTDGKTTTVHMIYQVLKDTGKSVSLVSSVGAIIDSRKIDTGLHVTTPSPWQIQKLLKRAVESKSEYFILEATSHGLDQNRLAFVNFEVAALTNVSQEHLDYHKNWQNYLKSKSKLFKSAKISVLNKKDPSFKYLRKLIRGRIVTYNLDNNADFSLNKFQLRLKIPGQYNLENALCATAAAASLGVNKQTIKRTLEKFQGVEGRMQKIDLGQDFEAIIDFAHTPNALENALKTMNSEPKNQDSRIICVFGSAGERDKSKREPMGEVAAKLADVTILTAEDPRREKVEDICAQIAKGLIKKGKKESKDFYQIYDRKKAIEFAVNLARGSDSIAFFGKGHEKSICIGKKEYPWDEALEVKGAIRRRLNVKKSR